MEINLNEQVEVILTDYGLKVYNDYFKQFCNIHRISLASIGKTVDRTERRFKTQLHDLFQIFGSTMHAGSFTSFESCNIKILIDNPLSEIPPMPKVKPPRKDITETEAENQSFGNVLAIIHRDSGHYITEHGHRKASEDAIRIIQDMRIALEDEPERIIHAAILRNDGHILTGKQHSHIIVSSPYDTCKEGAVQGFLTSKGRFVDNIEAGVIAHQAGQTEQCKNVLLSEHLWSHKENGRYDYDPKNGYVLKG